jgi:type 1 fimbria pilin
MPGFNAMMKMKSILIAIAAATLTFSSTAFAQTAHMTGKVIAVTSHKITVQSGKEVWEINLTASTKVSGDKKVGSTVTVTYNAPDAQKKE